MKIKCISLLGCLLCAACSYSQNYPSQLPSGDFGLGMSTAPDNRLHIKGSEGYLLKLEGTNFSGFTLQAGTASKKLGLHFVTDGTSGIGTNSLRFGRYGITGDRWGTQWEANPVTFDMDAPDASLHLHENGNLGLGVLNPQHKLEILTTNLYDGISLRHGNGFLRFYPNGLTAGAFNPVTKHGDAGIIFGGGSEPGQLTFGLVLAPWSNQSGGLRIDNNGNVGIGTSKTSDANYHLFVEKGIRTRKVKVDQTTWADYVFDKNYHLPTLAEVEKYIQTNHHLPEVPSTAEVEKNGLDLGDNQAILLRKIEELTLYVIEQNKKLEEQNRKIELQQTEINTLKFSTKQSRKNKTN